MDDQRIVAGLDVGTTGVKALIVNPNGIVVQRAGDRQPELLACDADLAASPLRSD